MVTFAPDLQVAEGRVPTAFLLAPLERELARRRPGARIAALARESAPYGSSWWLEYLTLTLADGAVVPLVLKQPGRPVPGSGADRIKPLKVLDPLRELWVYRHVLGRSRTGAPECWGAVPAPAGSSCIFLERIQGAPLTEVGDFDVWRAAAVWLGRFHVRFARRAGDTGPLIRHDARLHRWWFLRALVHANGGHGAEPSDEAIDVLARIEAVHRRATSECLRCAPTLLHGEFYASNVLVDGSEGERRIRPVDWEMAAVGPPLLDLAALVAGWSDDACTELVRAYRGAVCAAGGRPAPEYRLRRALTACRLLMAVQWLGWGTAGWTPPVGHRTDWLEEAVQCAEEL